MQTPMEQIQTAKGLQKKNNFLDICDAFLICFCMRMIISYKHLQVLKERVTLDYRSWINLLLRRFFVLMGVKGIRGIGRLPQV